MNLTSNKREGLDKVFLVLLSISATYLLVEVLVRFFPISDKMGWTMNPPVETRVANARPKLADKKRVMVLGDSFTEWRDVTNHSYVRIAEKDLKNAEFINLGQGGTDIPDYYLNLVRYVDILDPDLILVGLYLGNDLKPHHPPIADPNFLHSNPPPKKTRFSLNQLAKKSVLANIIFRLGKEYIPAFRTNALNSLIRQGQLKMNKSPAYVRQRLEEVPADLLDAARSDKINPWDLAGAIFDPQCYANLANSEPGNKGWKNVEAGIDDLITLINFARSKGKKVGVVLIPPSTWVSKKYHGYFLRLGYTELGPVSTPVPMLEALKVQLSNHNVPYLDALPEFRSSESNLYLENDTHLNMDGHALLGKMVAQWIKDKSIE